MNDSFNFSEFSRQSSKGIVVIYLKNIYTFFKKMWVIFLPIIFSKNNSEKLKYIFILIAVILVFTLIRSVLSYLNYRFKIENNHFILKHGILRKKQVSIPFDRIQNINFNQNFIHQLINIVQVEVETAGAKSVEISIKALSREKAIAIKNTVFSKKNIAVNQENEIEHEANKPLLKISLQGLLKESITENHFKSFALLIATIFGLYSQNEKFFNDLELAKTAEKNIQEVSNTTSGLIIIISLILIISVIISFTKIILKHFNLTVYYKNEILEIVQGLLTKKHQVLKKNKVQSIIISTNPLKKLLNISSVYFKQIANSKKANKKSLPTRIIGCQPNHINTIKDFLYSNLDLSNSNVYKPHKYYIFQMIIRSFIFIIIPNITFIVSKDYNLLLFNLLIIPLILFFIYKKYKKSYFKFNKNLIVIGSGQVGTNTTYFEYFKLQSIQLKQTIFQKKRNICDVILQSATGNIKLPCINKLDANNIYNYFLYQTENSTKEWM